MIYLIGGSPRSGKSILSRQLAKKLNIGYISTDNLRPVIIKYFSRRQQALKFPFIKMFDSTEVEKFFQKYDGESQLKADLIESRTIWPGVRSLIDHLIACRMDYVIEGVHLLPNYINRLKKHEKELKIAYLVKRDAELLLKGLKKSRENNDWIAAHIKDDDVLRLAARSIAVYGEYFYRETGKYSFKTINTEIAFNNKLRSAMEYLLA